MAIIDTIRKLLPATLTPAERLDALREKRGDLARRLEDAKLEAEASETEAGTLAAEALLDGRDLPAMAGKAMERNRLLTAGLTAAIKAADVAIADAEKEVGQLALAAALEIAHAESQAFRKLRIRVAGVTAAAAVMWAQKGRDLPLLDSGFPTDEYIVTAALRGEGFALPAQHLHIDRTAELRALGATPEQLDAYARADRLEAASIRESTDLAKRIVALTAQD